MYLTERQEMIMSTPTRTRRKFTEEFKRQMVALYENGKPRSEIIRDYELAPSVFDRWIKHIRNSGSSKAKDNRSPEQNELMALRKENARLRMEVDILKEAALILGRKER